MFDAIAPRYDLVNRIMTFRMDVGWRRKTVRSLGLPAVVHGARPGVRHRRPLPRAGVERAAPDRRRPVLRDAGRRPHRRAAACTATPCGSRSPTRSVDGVTCGFALRNFASLPPFFAELARVVRPGGRVALLEVAEPPNRLLRAGHGFYFGKVVPLVGGLLSDPAAYRYLPRSVAYLPEPAVMLDAARARRASTASTAGCCRSASRSSSPARGRRPRDRRSSPPPGASTRTSTCWRWPGATACCSSAAAAGWPGGASRRGCRWPRPTRSLGGHRGRRRGRRARAPGPVAFGALPYRAGPATELVIPEVVWGRADDGTRWVTTIAAAGRADARRRPGAPRDPLPPPSSVTVAPGAVGRVVVRAGGPGHQGDARRARGRAQQGRAGAGGAASRPTCPSTGPSCSSACAASYPGCFLFHVDGFLGASPELLVSRTGDVVRAQPMAGTAPRGGDPATDARLAASLLASPTYRHEHQITIDMVFDTLIPWCSYLDYEPEPSVVGVANVQHLATMVEGRLSQPAPSILELVAALHPTPAVNGWPRDEARGWIEEQRGLRPRPLRRHRRLGRRPRQRHLRGQHPLRRRRRHHRPPRRRQRHRRRQRPRHRAGRDPGQAPSHAQRPHPRV